MRHPKNKTNLSLAPLDETAKRKAWFDEQQQQSRKDAVRSKRQLRMQRLVQLVVALHTIAISAMLAAGIFIIVRLVRGDALITDPDTQTYMLYVKIYIGVFMVNAAMYLLYATISKKRNA